MPSFRYRAMTATGAFVTGEIDAPSQTLAIEGIRSLGHYPIDASQGAAARSGGLRALLAKDIFPTRRLSARALMVATQQLAVLLKAGLELERVLEILVALDEMKPIRASFESVLERVRAGTSLADALSEQPAFPKYYVNVVRAGEQGGHLELAMEQLGEYLGRAQMIHEAVVSALIYPAILLATAGISVIVVLVFVLPAFAPLFAEAGKALPLSTQIVMDTGDFLTAWGWAILLGLFGLGIALRAALREPKFRLRWDAALLSLPLLGKLFAKIDVERFSRMLGTMLKNGVALPQGLLVTAETLSNGVIAAAVKDAATSLKEGDELARTLRATGRFPTLALDMIRVGEESGQLDTMLLKQADLYERDIKHTIDRLVALLVPCLTILMGVLVAGLIGSILVAILSVNDLAI